MEQAAYAYRESQREEGRRPDCDGREGGCSTHPARGEGARLFREVHLADPATADRLARGLTSMPRVGDTFLGFQLIGELGRGAFGRVYLARQGELADRPVALKVSPGLSSEPRSLAQLQHTNIVPIYSIHRADPLQAVCMPYFGSTTLRDVYEELENREGPPVSGRDLLSGVHTRRSGAPTGGGSDPASTSPSGRPSAAAPATMAGSLALGDGLTPNGAIDYIERLSYVEAVLWFGLRLAGGLAHAHGRGILHLDLKPANILVSDEGQPMLLDFNLAEDLKARSGSAAAIGGTLPYMAPEHLDAFRGGPRRIDARSDLYALGIILYELLTRRRPFDQPDGPGADIGQMIEERLGPPPEVRPWNEAVSPAAESIVRHCLEPDPDDRYQSARQLQEDLERQLADLPLRHAPEPSARELIGKWVRRHPVACNSTSIALLSSVLIALLGAFGWGAVEERNRAQARLHRSTFRSVFEECQLLLNTNGGPSASLARGIRLARGAIEGYGVGKAGDWTASHLVRALPAAERRTLRRDVAELILLEVRASVYRAEQAGPKSELRGVLLWGVGWLDRAERIDPHPTRALYEQREQIHAALGQGDLAARDRARATLTPATSARDHYLIGTALLARGEATRAESWLARAVALDPRRFWSWFALGIGHADQGRYADAAYDFSVCTTLAPGFTWPHLNRGLSLARAGRLQEARLAYDRALEIDPNFPEALADRALTCLELGDAAQALRDLGRLPGPYRARQALRLARAEALGRLDRVAEAERALAEAIRARPSDPMPLVARGFTRLARDRDGAEADFLRALDLDPRNARAFLGRALLRKQDQPASALELAERALGTDPDLVDALQLRALVRARLGDPAAEADVERLIQAPSPHRLYNAACALSLLSRNGDEQRLVDRGLVLLRRAIQSGMSPACFAADPDLDALRHDRRYPALISPP